MRRTIQKLSKHRFFQKARLYQYHWVLILLILGVVYQAFGPVLTRDFFWHLRTAQDWVERGLSPLKDHYSFTYEGAPVRSQPLLFQLIGYASVKTFSLITGMHVLRAILFSIPLVLAATLLRSYALPFFVHAILLLFVAFGIISRPELRPEMTAYIFVLLFFLWLKKGAGKPTLKNGLLLLGLGLIWVNTHSSVIFLYLLFGAYWIQKLVDFLLQKKKKNPKELLQWTCLGIGLFLVGFCNLSLRHPLIEQLHGDSDWKGLIVEYRSETFADQQFFLRIYWIVFFLFAPLALYFKRVFEFIIVSFLAYQTALVHKYFPHLIVVSLIPFVTVFQEVVRVSLQKTHWLKKRHLKIVGVCIFVGASLAFIKTTLSIPVFFSLDPDISPVEVSQYIEKQQLKGKIFNTYAQGGYLLYRHAPDLKVYIDGRTNILYPKSFMKHYMDTGRDVELFQKEYEKFSFPWMLTRTQDPEFNDVAIHSGKFKILFESAFFSLLTDGPSPFPVSSVLMVRPDCWDKKFLPQIRQEHQIAQKLLTRQSDLRLMLEFLTKVYETKASEGAIDQFAYALPSGPDRTLRLAAHLCWLKKKYRAVIGVSDQIRRILPEDLFYALESLLKIGEKSLAQLMIQDIERLEKLSKDQALILAELLDRVKSTLEVSPSFIEKVRTWTQNESYNPARYRKNNHPTEMISCSELIRLAKRG